MDYVTGKRKQWLRSLLNRIGIIDRLAILDMTGLLTKSVTVSCIGAYKLL